MKAILEYSLYRRLKPTNQEMACGYLPAGSVIEVTNILEGATLDGISIWMEASDGFFYWCGGLNLNGNEVFLKWDQLDDVQKSAVAASIVNDKSGWLKTQITDYKGCAVGYKNDDTNGTIGLTIFVGKKEAAGTIGKTIYWKGMEVPVDFKETGLIREFGFIKDNNADLLTPILVGGKISNGGQFWGTRSMCISKDGKNYLVTCFHVLLEDLKKKEGVDVEFTDSRPSKVNAVFPFQNTGQTYPIRQGIYNSERDFCIVELPESFKMRNRIALDILEGDIKNYVGYFELQMLQKKRLFMSGAKSGIQDSVVKETNGIVKFSTSPIEFHNLIITSNMSSPGDSGAPVVDEQNNLVGIVIGGDEKSRTYILPVYGFLANNGYSLPKNE